MFSSRILTVTQRFSGLLLNRTYAKPGITTKHSLWSIFLVKILSNTERNLI